MKVRVDGVRMAWGDGDKPLEVEVSLREDDGTLRASEKFHYDHSVDRATARAQLEADVRAWVGGLRSMAALITELQPLVGREFPI